MTFACVPGTVVYGMPIGPPSHRPDPKSACSEEPPPSVAMNALELDETGNDVTAACQ